MHIGILQCDSVLDEFQSEFGDYPAMFMRLMRSIEDDIQFSVYAVNQQQYPRSIDECDAYLTTGSRLSVYDPYEWIESMKSFLRTLFDHQIKLIAVCFGHQLVAETLGGKTQRSEKGWGVGVHNYTISQQCEWMQPPQSTLNLIVSHQDQVTQLPAAAVHLGGNEFCPNALFQVGSFLCTQGHPEFTKQYAETLMRHREEKIEASVFQSALRSFEKPVDDATVAAWMLNFLIH